MPINEFHMRVINGAFNIIGNFISTQMSKGKDKRMEKSVDNYYKKASSIVEKYGDQTESPVIETTEKTHTVVTSKPDEGIEMDLTEGKIEEGTACLGCSKDHFTQASTLLEEAANFSMREKGMKNGEVTDRMHAALQQLIAMERWDLKPEKIENLQKEEKELAHWAKNKSADLRHMLNNAKTPDDLNKVSAEASNVSKEMFAKVLEMTNEEQMSDNDVVNKLCGHLSGDAKEQCIAGVSPVLPGA